MSVSEEGFIGVGGGTVSVKDKAVLVWLEGPDQTRCVPPGSGAPGAQPSASCEDGGSGLHWASPVNTHSNSQVTGPGDVYENHVQKTLL